VIAHSKSILTTFELIKNGLPSFLFHSHTHAPLARAMSIALKVARLNDKFQDPLFLFLELTRAGVMRGNLLSGRAFSGGPSFGTGECVDNAGCFCWSEC
jgi:hypothetical protein